MTTATTRTSALAVLLVGWAARLYRLDGQSFWYDEGTSATVAPRDLATILQNAAADIHPPLYYLLLHVWIGPTGTTEWAIRMLSAIFGLLTVAFVYRLGRDVLGPLGGFVGTLLAALAPLPVWYSQEARMYALATLAGAGATLLLLRAVARPDDRRLWAAYAVATAATLYSHYFAATVPLAHAAAMACWAVSERRRRATVPWLVASAAGGLLFLPWMLGTLGQLTGWPATAPPYGSRELVARTLGLIALGQGADRLGFEGSWPLALALVVGALWLLSRRRDLGRWLVPLALVVPLLAMFAVSRSRPFFHPKFVLLVTPYADLLAAAAPAGAVALAGRWRLGPVLAAALVVPLVAWRFGGTWAQWNDPRLARDDYRGLAAAIAAQERPGDAVVLNAPGQIEIFDLYFRGQSARYPLPTARPPDRAETEAQLGRLAERHPRVWLVLWAAPESDPEGLVERWLDERMYETAGRWFGGVRLALYLNPRLTELTPERYEVGGDVGGIAELRALELLPLDLRPGQAVPLTLEWRSLAPADRRYTVFIHLIDRDEYLWGQRDSEPAGGTRPTDGWRPGETVVDRVGLPILPGTPPGRYWLELGMYRPDTGERLPIRSRDGRPAGDRLLVGPVEVGTAREAAPPAVGHRLEAEVAGLRLLGFDLHPLGRDEAPPEVGRGEPLLLTLHWRAGDRARARSDDLRLLFARGGLVAREQRLTVGRGRYPPDAWAPDEYVRDPHRLPTDALAPGTYRLELADAAGPGRGAALGEVVVR
ncbi:MAG TPA: glycosyltransferase family 39 protein [Chloroflexota bacterium]|nr:glycosyltransferase family 39 protein [Chloroflexota bacterium]